MKGTSGGRSDGDAESCSGGGRQGPRGSSDDTNLVQAQETGLMLDRTCGVDDDDPGGKALDRTIEDRGFNRRSISNSSK